RVLRLALFGGGGARLGALLGRGRPPRPELSPGVTIMAGCACGFVRAVLAFLLAPALVTLLVAPARGRGGRGHGDWGAAELLPPLPPREDAALVARFVTNVCDWGALATISTQEGVRGRPFADVLSLSDGPPGKGSGVPYFYLSPLQQSVGNLQENPYATLTMSLAETSFCRKYGFDPQSPLCAHIILSGTVIKVSETEMDVAKNSLFIRHPEMKTWPSSHNWFFAKLNITNIWVLDYFGGPKIVTPAEYYNATFQLGTPSALICLLTLPMFSNAMITVATAADQCFVPAVLAKVYQRHIWRGEAAYGEFNLMHEIS
ncbi:CREG1, partial [Cervus elaphus hippelaphus]